MPKYVIANDIGGRENYTLIEAENLAAAEKEGWEMFIEEIQGWYDHWVLEYTDEVKAQAEDEEWGLEDNT